MPESTVSSRARTLFFEVWATIGVLLLLAAVGWLLGRMSSVLVTFGTALVIVVLLRGPVAWLADRGVPRALAVAVCYLGAALLVGLALTFIVPTLAQQIGDFITALPDYINRAYRLWLQVTEPKGKPIVPDWVTTAVLNVKDSAVSSLAGWSTTGLSFAVSAGSQAISGLIGGVLALIIGFYTLTDLPKLTTEALSLVPERYREEAQTVTATVSRVLGGWLRGALIDCVVVGVLMSVGLALVGVPYSVPIGIIGGVLNIVPYLGPAIAAVLAGLAGFFVDPWKALWAVLVMVAVQQFDGLWLNPRIMSKNVDLHPVLVVFSLLTGAALFGLPGMLLAVPVAAIVKGLFVYFYERRTRRNLCTDDGALFRTPKQDRDRDDDAPDDDADDGAADHAGDDEDRDA